MSCRGYHVGVWDGVWIDARSHQAGNVCHINKQVSTDSISNLAELSPVHETTIGTETTDDELWFVLKRDRHKLVVIDFTGRIIDAVLNRVVDLAREVNPCAVCEVPTICKTHPHHGVTRL